MFYLLIFLLFFGFIYLLFIIIIENTAVSSAFMKYGQSQLGYVTSAELVELLRSLHYDLHLPHIRELLILTAANRLLINIIFMQFFLFPGHYNSLLLY